MNKQMSMSKQDFIALADAIKDHNKAAANHSLAQPGSELNSPFCYIQLETLADFCKRPNSNFMKRRWLDCIAGKCGKNGGAVK